MKKILLSLYFLSFISFSQESIRYIPVDTKLRNENLKNVVLGSIKSEIYYEDEGVETRIKDYTQEPTISLIGKIGRKAVYLEVITEMTLANYYVGSHRRAPPYSTKSAYCVSVLEKNEENLWEAHKTDCDIYQDHD